MIPSGLITRGLYEKRITHRFVGISSKPISKKICLNSCLTFINGCRAPLFAGAPRALKLYGLKVLFLQSPEYSISAVRSVSSLTIWVANLGPLLILKDIRFTIVTSLRFFKSVRIASECVRVDWIMRRLSRVTSLIEGT